MGREFDIEIAEAMGWTVCNECLCDPRPVIKNGVQTGDIDIHPVAPLPVYSGEDLKCFIDTLDETKKIEYIQELSEIIGIPSGEWTTKSVFLVSNATFECKAKAFLRVKKHE